MQSSRLGRRPSPGRSRRAGRWLDACWAVGLGLVVLALTSPAAAQRKVIRLEAIKVEGRIQKPQAFYILQRSNLNFEGLDLKQSFLPKIVKSIEEKPF